MTRTEDRLTEYLSAVADSVRADNTRPLTPPSAPAPERARWARPRGGGRRRWRGWALPLAAAAAVTAVAAFGAVLAGDVGGHRAVPGSATKAAPTAPGLRYYMEAEGLPVPSAVIRSVATGAVVDRVPNPGGGRAVAMAAAPDDRTFYVAYVPRNPSVDENRVTIYSVTVLGSGRVTGPAPVKGGAVTDTDSAGPALAVSPDGERLAITLTIPTRYPGLPEQTANAILVIDPRTGARQLWQGGLGRAGYTVTLGSLAWARGGRSLDFLATWCPNGAECAGDMAVPPRTSSEVRSLPLSTRSGSLDAGAVLLSTPYSVAAMTAAPGGGLDLLTLSGQETASGRPRTLTVSQVTADGTHGRVLYHRAYAEASRLEIFGFSLTADPSGARLLLGVMLWRCKEASACGSSTSTIGWIASGTFHPLPSYANLTAQTAW